MILRPAKIAADVRDFVARRFAQECRGGATASQVADTMRAALPQEQHWAITEIENLFAVGVVPPRWAFASRVLGVARARGARPELAFAAYERSAELQRPALSAAFAAAAAFGAYLTVLVVMLAFVVTCYSIYVLPQFQIMFDIMGARLPGVTSLMLGSSWIVISLLALLIIATVGFNVGLRRFRQPLLALEPMRPVLGKLPGLRGWAASHDTEMWMRYFAIFSEAGLSFEEAQAAAADIGAVPDGTDHRVSFLGSAAKLGRLREELDAQVEESRHGAVARFEKLRNVIANAVRVAVYLIVAAYILAMYLPIFKLGAIV